MRTIKVWINEEIKMKLIVGLGNIGKEYEKTKHNIGFMFLEELADKWNIDFKEEKRFKGSLGITFIDKEKVFFLKPSTYMNLSGEAVFATASYYDIPEEDILVIYDDMDLPVGESRFKQRGSSGGQKGMGNIIEILGSDRIPRLKIGIGRGKGPLQGKDYVLSTFSEEERKIIEEEIKRNIEGIEIFIKRGIAEAMNQMNGKKDEQ